jgi:hypothetical protein
MKQEPKLRELIDKDGKGKELVNIALWRSRGSPATPRPTLPGSW